MRIEKAAIKNWLAAAWILERVFPAEYGRRRDIEITGHGGGTIQGALEIQQSDEIGRRIREDPEALALHTAMLKRLGMSDSDRERRR